MSVMELFSSVTEKGRYRINYLEDGWTREIFVEVSTPSEALMVTQNILGDICGVTYIEKV